MRIKARIYEILEKDRPGDKISETFHLVIIALIVLNIAAVILSSFSDLPAGILLALSVFEIVSVVIFSAEYVLRVWTSPLINAESKQPYLSFVFSFMAVIDLLAILPFYLPFIIPVDLRFLRMLRLLRLLRILKLNRYNDSMDIIVKIFKREKEKLITTFFVMAILILFSSSLMYYVENEAQPDKFPNIVASLWWAVATLTTVGYGDVYPITALGKLFSGVIALLGIGLVALPTGIISSGFITEVNNNKAESDKTCPHCGGKLGR
jgi:voltage-gated potassium channel